jgi:hypothetical protein
LESFNEPLEENAGKRASEGVGPRGKFGTEEFEKGIHFFLDSFSVLRIVSLPFTGV